MSSLNSGLIQTEKAVEDRTASSPSSTNAEDCSSVSSTILRNSLEKNVSVDSSNKTENFPAIDKGDQNEQTHQLNDASDSNPACNSDNLIIDENETTKKMKRGKRHLNKTSDLTQEEDDDASGWIDDVDGLIQESAKKAKLSATNIKSILKHIVTNKHVLAMVRNTMGENSRADDPELVYEPKLTRSKTKEMIQKNEAVPWPISPIKRIRSREKKIIEAEFKEEESSDEEYQPQNEDYESDEESMSSSRLSEIGSPQCSLPASPASAFKQPLIPAQQEIEHSADSSLDLTESDLIASRTRSKLPLTETPLECIESQFIAPDFTTDMYDTECYDEEWKEFLSQFILPHDHINADDIFDEENDPEYNILEDEDKLDKWETRDDKAVRISKIELTDLMKDLFESAHEDCFEDIETEGYGNDQSTDISGKEDNVEPVPAPPLFTHENFQQLELQMSMHIQFLSQSYVLACENPNLQTEAECTKSLLMELNRISVNKACYGIKSYFAAANLKDAVNLVTNFNISSPKKKTPPNKTRELSKKIHDILVKDPTFIFPNILPIQKFYYRPPNMSQKCIFTSAEDGLFAMGIEQFDSKAPYKAYNNIIKYMMPLKTYSQLRVRYKNVKASTIITEENPLRYYIIHRKLKPVVPTVIERPNNSVLTSIMTEWMASRRQAHRAVKDAPVPILPAGDVISSIVVSDAPIIYSKSPPATKKKAVISHKQLGKSPVKKAMSPLQQISPILKKYNLMNRKIPRTPSPVKPILPHITPELLMMVAKRIRQGVNRVKRQILPKEPDDSEKNKKKTKSVEKASNKLPIVKATKTANTVQTKSVDGANNQENSAASKQATCIESDAPENENTVASSSSSCATEVEDPSDNEDMLEEESADKDVDLDALMAASSRICPASKRGKKSKQQRELESTLTLLNVDNEDFSLKDFQKASVFAHYYLNRVYETLKNDLHRYLTFVNLLHIFGNDNAMSTVDLYKTISELLHRHPLLVDEFVGFLHPEEAMECGVFAEYLNIHRMRKFLRKLELHFEKNPSCLQKILRALVQFQNQADFTSADLKSSIVPLLRGQQHLIDEFLSILPDERPPESLMTDFEEIEFTANPDEDDQSDDGFERITLPSAAIDRYGGKDCPCECHTNTQNARYISRIKHCASCGTKFIDGRVYIQLGKTLKQAKVIYHQSKNDGCSEDDVKNIQAVENILTIGDLACKENVRVVSSHKNIANANVANNEIPSKVQTVISMKPIVAKANAIGFSISKLNEKSAEKHVDVSIVGSRRTDDQHLSKKNNVSSSNSNVDGSKSSSSSEGPIKESSSELPEVMIENTMLPINISSPSQTNIVTDFSSLNTILKPHNLEAGRSSKLNPDASETYDARSRGLAKVDRPVTSDARKRKVGKESDGLLRKKKKTVPGSNLAVDRGNALPTSSIWSREDDKILLMMCKEHGPNMETFELVAKELGEKSIEQVQSRLDILMNIFSSESNSNHEGGDS